MFNRLKIEDEQRNVEAVYSSRFHVFFTALVLIDLGIFFFGEMCFEIFPEFCFLDSVADYSRITTLKIRKSAH